MGDAQYQSWGRYPKAQQHAVKALWRHEDLPLHQYHGKCFIPFGNGRSYGDVCLNDGGGLIDTRALDRFIHFDACTGVLRCEAGVLLSAVLDLIVSKGWFLPVTPGTKFVTVGGAIANDVHGKNHHRAGTFGCHVRCFELLRSDGTRLHCSREKNPAWFQATVGGLGLTGLITWAEIQLIAIANPYIQQETVRLTKLDDFLQISSDSEKDYEYTVAWVDCLAKGAQLGRGLFFRGNHAQVSPQDPPRVRAARLNLPFDSPVSLVNRWTLRIFNEVYYRKQSRSWVANTIHYEPFFYPLDSICNWNRIYGPNGFLQYQCVVPHARGDEPIREILERISRANLGSFLAVLKVFGDIPSVGLLSFPKRGITLALDFPNRGAETFALLNQLDEVVNASRGTVYPAKDARMSAESFDSYFPEWSKLQPYIDPRFSSSFWRRVHKKSS